MSLPGSHPAPRRLGSLPGRGTDRTVRERSAEGCDSPTLQQSPGQWPRLYKDPNLPPKPSLPRVCGLADQTFWLQAAEKQSGGEQPVPKGRSSAGQRPAQGCAVRGGEREMAGSEAEDCRATSREEPAFGCLRNPRAGASLVTVPEGRKSLGPGPGGGVLRSEHCPPPQTRTSGLGAPGDLKDPGERGCEQPSPMQPCQPRRCPGHPGGHSLVVSGWLASDTYGRNVSSYCSYSAEPQITVDG